MAVKKQSRWWSRVHLLIRLVGLTGLLAGLVGLALAQIDGLLVFGVEGWERLQQSLQGEGFPWLIAILLACGFGAALAALAIEIFLITTLVAGRLSLMGFNALLQVALALLLLIGVNLYVTGCDLSWLGIDFDTIGLDDQFAGHYVRADWTSDKQFTLPVSLENDLRKLKGQTTIVVYQEDKAFGGFAAKSDAYDKAARAKVVEKVQDLVEQFREFGPQFKVVVLDAGDQENEAAAGPAGTPAGQAAYRARSKGYKEKLDSLPEELRKEVMHAPESSIFFHADGKVRRMSFNQFYRLDKEASRQDSNLVLNYQGVKPFARNIFNIDEKRPRVVLAVVHEYLSTLAPDDIPYTLAGLRKSLNAHGFDVRDVILKKGFETGPPQSAAFTFDESKLDRLEDQIASLEGEIKQLKKEVEEVEDQLRFWQETSPNELARRLAGKVPPDQVEDLRDQRVLVCKAAIARGNTLLSRDQDALDKYRTEKAAMPVDRIAEEKRLTDLKVKLERTLGDCDLLVVSRLTLRNAASGDRVPYRIYPLTSQEHLQGIKDHMKAGKPVLACLGPINEAPQDVRFANLGPGGPDAFEQMLSELGIHLSPQAVLFNVERQSYVENRSNPLGATAVQVPNVRFEPASSVETQKPDANLAANPIRTSLLLTERSVGQPLDLRLRNPRPIYYDPEPDRIGPVGALVGYVPGPALPWAAPLILAFHPRQATEGEAVFMTTDEAGWNDNQPFATEQRIPHAEPSIGRYELSLIGALGSSLAILTYQDPGLDRTRRGSFPIAVTVETTLPVAWGAPRSEKVRVAAIGHGGVFAGEKLPPANEKLLLDTCNWLLGRQDSLAQDNKLWDYPRVDLTVRQHAFWQWGAWFGLPAIVFFLGLVVLLVRRVR